MPTIGIAKRILAIGIIAVDLDPLVDILMDMILHGLLSLLLEEDILLLIQKNIPNICASSDIPQICI